MSGGCNQDIRLELLMKALDASSDPEEALCLARRMEEFILVGCAEQVRDKIETAERVGEPAQPAPSKQGRVSKTPAGAKKPRWSPADEQQLRDSWQNGITIAEMAEKLGRTEVSIIARARRMGLPFRRSKKTGSDHRRRGANRSQSGAEPTAEADIGGGNERGASDGREPRRHRKSKSPERAGSPCRSITESGAIATSLGREQRELEVSIAADTMESVITFMRSRDYSVVRNQNGTFLLDGHTELTGVELVARANRLRGALKKPAFQLDGFLEAVG